MLGSRGPLMRREYVGYNDFPCRLAFDSSRSTYPFWKRVEDAPPNTEPGITIASKVTEIEDLVRRNANYPTMLDLAGYSCLHLICSIHSRGQVEVLKVLCSANVDVNVLDNQGRTPLHHALSPQNLECHWKSASGYFLLLLIEALINMGANVNALDNYDISPFHLALDVYDLGYAGRLITLPTILSMLIAAGADVSHPVPSRWLHTGNTSCQSTVMHLACCMKGSASKNAVELLISRENVNCRDSSQRTPLHDLIDSIGKSPLQPDWTQCDFLLRSEETLILSKLSFLFDLGADVNATDLQGSTPLRLAVEKHDSKISSEVIIMLIQHGATVNVKFPVDGTTPLHLLCRYLDRFAPHVLKRFLKAGGQLNAANREGQTPFHYAVMNPRCRILTLMSLWASGAIVTATDFKGFSALHFVCSLKEEPNIMIAKYLLEIGCSIEGRNHLGDTPLLLSLRSRRNPEFVETLIDFGADVRVTNYGISTLHMACTLARRTSASLIHKIINGGADVNATERFNLTPLMHEVLKHYDENEMESIKLLLLAGADPNIGNSAGKRPLHFACRYRHRMLAELLLDFGADVNLVDADGRTPLHEATTCKIVDERQLKDLISNNQLVDMIIKRGADVNAKDRSNVTALQYEIGVYNHGVNVRTVHLLLVAGADPNVGNDEGVRPLHIAAIAGNHSLTKLLLDFGADVNVVNITGQTPLHEATSSIQGDPNFTWMIMIDNGANPSAKDFEGNTPLMYLTCVTYKSFMAYIAIMASTGRYSLGEKEKEKYRDSNQNYLAGIMCNYFAICIENAYLLNEILIGRTTLAEFLLGPADRVRRLIKNPDITRELLMLRENTKYNMFYPFFQHKLCMLQGINSLNDGGIRALKLLYAKPLPLLVYEQILSHLTDLDLITLAQLNYWKFEFEVIV